MLLPLQSPLLDRIEGELARIWLRLWRRWWADTAYLSFEQNSGPCWIDLYLCRRGIGEILCLLPEFVVLIVALLLIGKACMPMCLFLALLALLFSLTHRRRLLLHRDKAVPEAHRLVDRVVTTYPYHILLLP